jgi:hypothetical protein
MNKNTIIAAVAFIVALPFIYFIFASMQSDPLPRFLDQEVAVVDPANGTIIAPSEEEALAGKPLTAKFTSSFIARTTAKKMTNTNGFDLTINSVLDSLQNCEAESAVPARASFNLAEMCAPFAFEKSKNPKKTSLFMAPEEQLIVFGQSGENLTRVYHKGLVATYSSADMTQSDRKYEACLVRIMMDFIMGFPLDEAKTCQVKS